MYVNMYVSMYLYVCIYFSWYNIHVCVMSLERKGIPPLTRVFELELDRTAYAVSHGMPDLRQCNICYSWLARGDVFSSRSFTTAFPYY